MEIIKQSWLDAGMTEEEYNQQDQIAELYEMLLASGRSDVEIDAEWKDESNAEILRAYAAPILIQTRT